jgi:hypothetical protein
MCWFVTSFFIVMYPAWCDFAMDPITKTLVMIRQAYGEDNMSPNSPRPKKRKTGEEQRAYNFLWHQGDRSQRIRLGRLNIQFRIALWVLRRLREDSPGTLTTKELAVASRQRTVSHLLFTMEFLSKSNITVVHHHPSFLFPRLKIQLKGRHFDTIEVVEAESHPHRTGLPGCI